MNYDTKIKMDKRLAELRREKIKRLIPQAHTPLNHAWYELEALGGTCDKTESDYAMGFRGEVNQ